MTDNVDENGNRISNSRKTPCYYDLKKIAADIDLELESETLTQIARALAEKGWVVPRTRNPIKVSLTREGFAEAEKINDIIFNQDDSDPDATIPASGRFVQLDDNSAKFRTAVSHLERLIAEAHAIRVNDWPEKEGVLESIKSGLNMLRSKYVNKRAVLATLSAGIACIASKFVEAPIADLANITWNAIKALF